MYAYEYETVTVELTWSGLGKANVYAMADDYRRIIDDRAAQGWRYAGYLPTKQRNTGHIQELDLIFEKEV